MRLHFLTLLGILFFTTLSNGQGETKFTVSVSKHEVRAGEPFDVNFSVENGKNGRFTTPNWESAGFAVLGSSQSSSFSISGGVANSTAIYQYRVMARDTGMLAIPSAVLKTTAAELRTAPETVHVLPGDGNSIAAPMDKTRPAPPAKDPKKKIKTIRL